MSVPLKHSYLNVNLYADIYAYNYTNPPLVYFIQTNFFEKSPGVEKSVQKHTVGFPRKIFVLLHFVCFSWKLFRDDRGQRKHCEDAHAHGQQLEKCWSAVMRSVAVEGMLSARVCRLHEWTRFTVGKIPYGGWGHRKGKACVLHRATRGHCPPPPPPSSPCTRDLLFLYSYVVFHGTRMDFNSSCVYMHAF